MLEAGCAGAAQAFRLSAIIDTLRLQTDIDIDPFNSQHQTLSRLLLLRQRKEEQINGCSGKSLSSKVPSSMARTLTQEQSAQHPGHGAHAPDPATDQTILTASEPPPPTYNTTSIAHDDNNLINGGPAQVVWGIIGFCVLCFIFYVFINLTTVAKPGRP